MKLYLGLMSGTSMDGIDAAILDLTNHKLITGLTKEYTPEVQHRLKDMQIQANHSLKDLCQLNQLIGLEFAKAANSVLEKANISSQQIIAIGSHGQTICHDGLANPPYTLQLGCAHTIAAHCKIPVVADFRTRDLVARGQGAPFAPIYHQALFANATENVALINIGGIANISLLMKDKPPLGWDLGPGNCLMDQWILRHLGQAYDENGTWANQGKIIPLFLDQLLSDSFFKQRPPKSIGKEYFSLEWLDQFLHKEYSAVDIQATLLALTAHCIADALGERQAVNKLYLCGGGVHNGLLHKAISDLLPGITVESIEKLGLSADYLEAMMFAWLAEKTINSKTVDLRSITGSKYPMLLGAIYPVCR